MYLKEGPFSSLRPISNWIFSCRLPNFEQNQSGRFFVNGPSSLLNALSYFLTNDVYATLMSSVFGTINLFAMM